MRLKTMIAAAVLAMCALPVCGQDVTLRLHQFLPADSFVPAHILTPWAEAIDRDSGGRIKVQRFDSMALGGKPADLADQVADGVVDVVWTLPGYTPGRFPRTEVIELPFMSQDAGATSKALWSLARDWPADEFRGLHLLGLWVHGPGVIHSAKAVTRLEDMRGLTLRAPSRAAAMLLEQVGAAAIGMPAPQIAEALSKGVIDGALLPWEVTTSVRVSELVDNHTEFPDRAVYTAVLMLAMNKEAYDSLPDDLRTVIENASGAGFSENAGRIQQQADAAPRAAAIAEGANVIVLSEDEAARWQAEGAAVVAAWAAAARGFDGAALVAQARAAIASAEAESR